MNVQIRLINFINKKVLIKTLKNLFNLASLKRWIMSINLRNQSFNKIFVFPSFINKNIRFKLTKSNIQMTVHYDLE